VTKPSRPRANRSLAAPTARKGAQHRAEVDRVGHAVTDVALREVVERRRGAGEGVDPGLVDAEAERLTEHDERVEDAAEPDSHGDGERHVATRIVGLLAERGCSFEAAEGEEAEDRRERDRTEPDSLRGDEGLEREVLPVRRIPADHLHVDDDDEDGHESD
jgi:hypothetical protein